MKKIVCLTLSLIMIFTLLCACSKSGGNKSEEVSELISGADSSNSQSEARPQVEMKMKDGGKFVIELYPEYAPKTVENFLKLVNDGFYNGLTFHRVVDGFMAQGGQPNSASKNTDKIEGEFASNGFSQNTLKHERGIISMARSQDKNSASSQFFICYDKASFLDGDYAAFGKVTEGMDVVDGFCTADRTYNSMGEKAVPIDPIIIESASQIK